MDALTFGSTVLLRHLTFSEARSTFTYILLMLLKSQLYDHVKTQLMGRWQTGPILSFRLNFWFLRKIQPNSGKIMDVSLFNEL